MNILIDINHPAHVHLYKNLYYVLKGNGHKIIVTTKEINTAKELLDLYSIPFISIGEKSDSLKGKFINQLKYNKRLLQIVRKNRINIAIGTSITIAHISKISNVKSIVLDDDDDEVQPLMVKFGHPFASVVLSPDVLDWKRKKKGTIYYAGYHELAYLHPNKFKPEPDILKKAGLKDGETYFVLRFNSFKAHHDVGVEGISVENKDRLLNLLLEHGKVFITTENDIDEKFKQFQIKIPPHKIHSFIYYSSMLIGDSQTMTSEAAVLGIPSIRSNSFVGKISYIEEEEHNYGLTYGFKPNDPDKMFSKINELLRMTGLKEEWQKRRQKLLADKIDVTAFLVWFVENYPESVNVMRENPDYQYRFK